MHKNCILGEKEAETKIFEPKAAPQLTVRC